MSDDITVEEHIEMLRAAGTALDKFADIHEDAIHKWGLVNGGTDVDASQDDIQTFLSDEMDERLTDTEEDAMEYLNL